MGIRKRHEPRDNVSSTVFKYGYRTGITSTTPVPVTYAGVYQTPATTTSLEIVSSSANDASAGSGAQQVTVIGIGSDWKEQTHVATLNGTTAVAITDPFRRVYRAYVSRSGTYATASAGSHAGDITVRAASAGATWCTIPSAPFPAGQSLIGAYTVPLGQTAYINNIGVYVDALKEADVYFFQRADADDVTTPYTGAMRLQAIWTGVSDDISYNTIHGRGPYIGPCDVGFLAAVDTGSANVAVEFELDLYPNGE